MIDYESVLETHVLDTEGEEDDPSWCRGCGYMWPCKVYEAAYQLKVLNEVGV